MRQKQLSNLPIYIDDKSSMNILNIRSTARRMKRENDIKLLIVDYLQLISPYDRKGYQSMVQHITETSHSLKQIAKELDIPVLALSQLSRDIEKSNREPHLSDLRDSGSIEQDADVVIFLHKENKAHYEGEINEDINLIIGKHRNGPISRVKVKFDKNHTSFNDIAKIKEESFE